LLEVEDPSEFEDVLEVRGVEVGADEVNSREHFFKPSPSRTTLTFARSGRIPDVTNE
jgi:hypothetical protein